MALIGYCRVSSTDQNPTAQREALHAAGCERIFEEYKSGAKRDGRQQLQEALEFVREGDTLVLTRLDRMARSLKDLLELATYLRERGVNLQCLFQPIDTSTPEGRLFYAMLGAFAEFELELRRERQKEGIASAKAKGKYLGGGIRKITKDMVLEALDAGACGPSEVARRLGCNKATVYRAYPDGPWGPSPFKEKTNGRASA